MLDPNPEFYGWFSLHTVVPPAIYYFLVIPFPDTSKEKTVYIAKARFYVLKSTIAIPFKNKIKKVIKNGVKTLLYF